MKTFHVKVPLTEPVTILFKARSLSDARRKVFQDDSALMQIMRRCHDLLELNNAHMYDIQVAQAICIEQRNNEALKTVLADYVELFDSKTDGALSAAIKDHISKIC